MTSPTSEQERTAEAWERTALGTTAFGVALLRVGVVRGATADVLAGVIALLGGVALAVGARRYHRHDAHPPSTGLVRWVTAVTVGIGVLAVVAAIARGR